MADARVAVPSDHRCADAVGTISELLVPPLCRRETPGSCVVLGPPQDKRLHQVDDQYMVGDRMLWRVVRRRSEPKKSAAGSAGSFWTGALSTAGTETLHPSFYENIHVSFKPKCHTGGRSWLFAGARDATVSVRVYGRRLHSVFVASKRQSQSPLERRRRQGGERTQRYHIDRWDVIGVRHSQTRDTIT